MRRERFNRWPDKQDAPDLWSHDLRALFKRLGIDPHRVDPKNPIAPALKAVLEWQRGQGYSVGKLPLKFANGLYDAAFGADGVVQWLADLYQIDI